MTMSLSFLQSSRASYGLISRRSSTRIPTLQLLMLIRALFEDKHWDENDDDFSKRNTTS